MRFSKALELMRQNAEEVTREDWGPKVFIGIHTPGGKMNTPYLYKYDDGELVPYLPSHVDLLAEDWQIFGNASAYQTDHEGPSVMTDDDEPHHPFPDDPYDTL